MDKSVFACLTNLEEGIYSTKAILSVCIGSLISEYSKTDDLSTVLSVAEKNLEECQDAVEALYKMRREFFLKDSSKRTDDREMDFPVEDDEGEDDSDEVEEEDDSEAKKDHSGPDPRGAFLSSSLKVDLMEEHDDGSATYTITSSDGTLHRLFEAFFVHAMIEGIKSVEVENQKFVSLKKAATDLERVLQVWENSDVLDYDPEIKGKREALTKALYSDV